MSSNATDLALVDLITTTAPDDIGDVIDVMTAIDNLLPGTDGSHDIDNLLPGTDGLKWFNWLYLTVTRAVLNDPAAARFHNPHWLTRLDVIFAEFYFAAVKGFLTQHETPSSWQALFEARHTPRIERI